eukprot:m.186611 g.186611  ORF g.186611 m.186611 type:complete len:138 (-) comp14758_c0_seq1:1305-1718(-)
MVSFASARCLMVLALICALNVGALGIKTFTAEQLAQYDGSDESKPILISVKGDVFDVTSGKKFYGPGSSYHILVGKDSSRAVALWSLDPKDMTHDLHGLTQADLDSLEDTYNNVYKAKYKLVGKFIPPAVKPADREL